MAAAVGKMAAPMAKKFLNDEASKYSGAGTVCVSCSFEYIQDPLTP